MLTRRSLILAFAATIASSACSGGGTGSTGVDGGTVVVSASTGTTPIYSWTGPLAVSITVARASAPSVAVWGISCPINRDIPSGSKHGVVPSDATPTATAEPVLTVGVKYRVTVALVDGTSGSVDFTP